MKIKFHPEARSDLREGKSFYRRRSPLAALAFAREIERAVERIMEAPMRYAMGEHGTRELVLPWRFPYTVVYKASAEQIVIVAIAHQSKEPEYWHHRA
jgi:toxin ParE1/3/4